jgi:type IV secretion system protein TrbL
VISFFIMAIQLFVSLIEFKLTTLAGFVLLSFALFGRTAFLADRVLGNVVSSGVKILALAVIVGIGSTIFGQFTTGLNNPPTISDALTLILAALTILGLSIFGPSIANGLIAGGPQLGAGAAVGTGSRRGRPGCGGRWARRRGRWRCGRGRRRGPRWRSLYRISRRRDGRRRGSGRLRGHEPASPRRRKYAIELCCRGSCSDGRRRYERRRRTPRISGNLRPAASARRMKRNQTISRGAAAANHAVRSGDHPASGGGVDLSEGE